MENSECLSHAKSVVFKWRRVSGVRDFPTGCGPFAHLNLYKRQRVSFADGAEKISDNKYPLEFVEGVRDFPPSCGSNASLSTKNFSQEKSTRGYKSPSSNKVTNNVQMTSVSKRSKLTCITKAKSQFVKKSLKKNHLEPVNAACQGTGALEVKQYPRINEKAQSCDSRIMEFRECPPCRSHDNDMTLRRIVKETLHLFRDECDKLFLEKECKRSRGEGTAHRRVDLEALKILKDRGHFLKSGKEIIGAVPGIEVGDKFHYRVELVLIGLHHQMQSGIAYGNFGGKVLATSVVASGGYADDMHSKDSLIYTGHGGNGMNRKDPEDQKLERGNLALKNSVDAKNYVRVIRGSESMDGSRTYFYDGLYLVEKYWTERGPLGKLVFKFQMNRITGIGN